MTRFAPALALLSMLLTACGVGSSLNESGTAIAAMTSRESAGLLKLVNDQRNTDFERLDVGCAIRSDSARKILRHRDGQDRLPFTSDDDLFGSVAELDGVSLVGPWTLEQLRVCAHTYGYISEPVVLSSSGRAVVDGVRSPGEWDTASAFTFDADLGDGHTVPATVQMMDDRDDLFVLVTLELGALPESIGFRMLFDNDADGRVQSGDDVIEVGGAASVPGYVQDFFDGNIQLGDGFHSDLELGGSSDGTVAIACDGVRTVIELSHPIRGGDVLDIDVAPGSATSFSAVLTLPHHSGAGVQQTLVPAPVTGVSGWGYYLGSEVVYAPVCPDLRQVCIDYQAFCGSRTETMLSCASGESWESYHLAGGDTYEMCDDLAVRCFEG